MGGNLTLIEKSLGTKIFDIKIFRLHQLHFGSQKVNMCIYNLPPLAFRLFRALGSSLAIIVFFGFVYLFIEGIGSFVGVTHISDRFSTQTCFAFFKNQDKIPIASDSVHLTFSSRKLTHLFCKKRETREKLNKIDNICHTSKIWSKIIYCRSWLHRGSKGSLKRRWLPNFIKNKIAVFNVVGLCAKMVIRLYNKNFSSALAEESQDIDSMWRCTSIFYCRFNLGKVACLFGQSGSGKSTLKYLYLSQTLPVIPGLFCSEAIFGLCNQAIASASAAPV